MKLFFDTNLQAVVFLLSVPTGFLAACFLSSGIKNTCLQMILDILTLLLAGTVLAALILIFRENGLRSYHLLGLLTGAILYLCGLSRVAKRVGTAYREKRNAGRNQTV